MASFDYGFSQQLGVESTQYPPSSQPQSQQQHLPCYNNNYEQRFQSLHPQSSQRPANGIALGRSSYAPQQVPMNIQVYEVRFKCTNGDYVLNDNLRVEPGDFVKVEADRGYDVGIIYKRKPVIAGAEVPRKRIFGHITADEMSILPQKIAEETQAVSICRQMAAHRGLLITIADVEFQFDRNKLTVIFASEGRVDFRELVRDMFSFFRIRIWMQKVSPSEAIALMELASGDGDGAGPASGPLTGGPRRDNGLPPSHQAASMNQLGERERGQALPSVVPNSTRRVIERGASFNSGKTSNSGDSPPPPHSSYGNSRLSPPPMNLSPKSQNKETGSLLKDFVSSSSFTDFTPSDKLKPNFSLVEEETTFSDGLPIREFVKDSSVSTFPQQQSPFDLESSSQNSPSFFPTYHFE